MTFVKSETFKINVSLNMKKFFFRINMIKVEKI